MLKKLLIIPFFILAGVFLLTFTLEKASIMPDDMDVSVALSYADGYYEGVLKAGQELTAAVFAENNRSSGVQLDAYIIFYKDKTAVQQASLSKTIDPNASAVWSVSLSLPEVIADSDYVRILVKDKESNESIISHIFITPKQTDYFSDTIEHANIVGMDKNIVGSINYSDDVDFIKLAPPEDGFYLFNAQGVQLFGKLFDAQRNAMLSTAGVSLKSKWSYELKGGQTYYFKMSMASGTGDYTLSIKKNETHLVKEQHDMNTDNPMVTTLAQSTAVLNNPYQGIMPNALGRYSFNTRIVTSLLKWNEIEPIEGEIDFDYIENSLSWGYWRSMNANMVVRLVLDYPVDSDTDHMEIPKWLYDKMETDNQGSGGTPYRDSGSVMQGKNLHPNYENPIMIEAHRSLVRRLGQKYNSDPFVAFVQLGSLGRWGEWNTTEGLYLPGEEVTASYVQPYLDYFSDKKFMSRTPNPWAIENGFGLYEDMIGYEHAVMAYTERASKNDENGKNMLDNWQNAPIAGEFGTKIENDKLVLWYDPSYIESTLVQFEQMHTSFFGMTYDNVNAEQQTNINRILNKIGYRLWISKVKADSTFISGRDNPVTLTWTNSGVAPFYFDWDVDVSLVDQTGNTVSVSRINPRLSKILPGGEYSHDVNLFVPEGFQGICNLTVTVISPYTGLQGLELANMSNVLAQNISVN